MTSTRYPHGPARSSSAGTVNSVVSIFPRNLTDGSCAMTVSVRAFGRLWRVPRTFRIVASDGSPRPTSLGRGLDEETSVMIVFCRTNQHRLNPRDGGTRPDWHLAGG